MQTRLGLMLKAVLCHYPDATYYQGLNGVMGLLLRTYSKKEEDAMQIFEGLLLYHLRDFSHLKFDQCLIPVFRATALVFSKFHTEVDSNELYTFLQSSRG